MNIQEKQEIINSKKWIELIKTNILLDFKSNSVQNYKFGADFLTGFVFNDGKITEHLIFLGDKISSNDLGDILLNILKIVRKNKVEVSTDDWKQIVRTSISLNNYKRIIKYTTDNILSLDSKDVNFLRILFDGVILNALNSYFNYVGSYSNNELNANEYKKLTLEEQKSFVSKLSLAGYKRIKIVNGTGSIFLSYARTYKDILHISKKITVTTKEIIKDLPADECLKIIINELKNDNKIDLAVWAVYFNDHPELVLSDVEFKLLHSIYVRKVFDYFINNMTDKMIDENINEITPAHMLKKREYSLDKITELFGKDLFDLSLEKFFTEEEIKKNPHFFDPRSLIEHPVLYCSKETFNLLNKTWYKKVRYDDNLTNFSDILEYIADIDISIDVLRYLKKKTNTSNEILSDILFKRNTSEKVNNFCYKISTIQNFVNAYVH